MLRFFALYENLQERKAHNPNKIQTNFKVTGPGHYLSDNQGPLSTTEPYDFPTAVPLHGARCDITFV